MKKVLIISYYWPPSGGAGVQRWLKFAKYLPEYNIQPFVLTVDPKYASYPILDNSLEKEVSDGVQVFKTKSREPFTFYKKITGEREIPYAGFVNQGNPGFLNKISRAIRGNFFIPDARIGWNKFAFRKALDIIREHKINTVITTSPPHSTQLIGLKLKKKTGVNWIADLRDPWTDIYYYNKLYHSIPAKKLDEKYERNVLTSADWVIVVSLHMKEMLANKVFPLIDHKIKVIPNGFDEDDFTMPAENTTEKFIITYTGTLTEEYDSYSFLQAISTIIKKSQTPVVLQFVGLVSRQVKRNIEQFDLQQSTIYIDHVSHQEALTYMMKSTILFLAIPHKRGNKAILSGKLFEYIATGKPVIGIGPVHGDASAILKECERGRMFDYKDLQGIISYLLEIIQVWRKNSENLVNTNEAYQKYSRKSLTGELTAIID
ncbi:MAG: glycosyltransferase family 4 protein [Bacteroidota bacterium]|nr:glycosyltransferase family 4 protein [Bacteroidota bacterium]